MKLFLALGLLGKYIKYASYKIHYQFGERLNRVVNIIQITPMDFVKISFQ